MQAPHNPIRSIRIFLGRLDFRVSLVYCMIALLWIGFSDTLLSSIVTGNQAVWLLSSLKGFGFVGVTTLALFAVLSTEMQKRYSAEKSLRDSEVRYRRIVET